MKRIKKFLKKMLDRILLNQGSSFIALAAAIIAILNFLDIAIISEETLVSIMTWLVVFLGFFFGQDKKE